MLWFFVKCKGLIYWKLWLTWPSSWNVSGSWTIQPACYSKAKAWPGLSGVTCRLHQIPDFSYSKWEGGHVSHLWQPLPEQISPAVKKEIHLSNRSCMTIPISLFEKFLVEGTSVSRAPLGNMKLAQITGQGCAGWCWDTSSVKWRFTVLCSCKWVLTKGGPCGGRTSRSGSVLIRGVKLQTLNLRPKWACWELCSIPETAAQRVWLTSCAAETPSNIAGDPAGVK